MHINNINESSDYWSSSGKYYKEYKELYNKLVPERGPSKFLNGELIRAVSRLLHEYYNNGNINAKQEHYEEECYDVDRWDDEANEYYTEEECEDYVADVTVSEFYNSFLDFIDNHGPEGIEEETYKVRKIICDEKDYSFNKEETKIYTELADKVIKYVINNYNFRTKLIDADEEYYNYHTR